MDANPEMQSKANCGASCLLILSLLTLNLWLILLAIFILLATSGERDTWQGWRCCVTCYYITVMIITTILCIGLCGLTILAATKAETRQVGYVLAGACCVLSIEISLAARAYAGFNGMYSEDEPTGQYYPPKASAPYYAPPPSAQYQPARP